VPNRQTATIFIFSECEDLLWLRQQKRALAMSLKKLLAEKPLDKITVVDYKHSLYIAKNPYAGLIVHVIPVSIRALLSSAGKKTGDSRSPVFKIDIS
jgi:hypothetical protein